MHVGVFPLLILLLFPNLLVSDFGRKLVSGSNGIGGYMIGEKSSNQLTNGVEQ